MNNQNKDNKQQSLKNKKDWIPSLVHSKKFVMSFIIATTMVGGTVVTQSFDGSVEKKEEVITTVQPNYNYFSVSLDNEKKDGLLVEAKAEIVAKQKIEEDRLNKELKEKEKAEEERKKKEAELKAKQEAEAIAREKAEAVATAKAKAKEDKAKAEKAKAEKEVEQKRIAEQKAEASSGYYNGNIPLPKDQQTFLYKKVKQRGLNYAEVLAFIKVESNFDPNARSSSSYGLFQINGVNHTMLTQTLGTNNDPFDPYVNIEWGTYMIADLYDLYRSKGLSGQALKDAVWSSYNKGVGGYQKTGKADSYISKMTKAQHNMQAILN